MGPWGRSVGQCWVSVSGELQLCARGSWSALCSCCVSPDGAGLALCCGVWVSEGQGAEGSRSPRPHVLARFPPQPLTVPDRTVDVRLCTERRAGREGEEEAQARSSRAVRFKLTLCFVGVEVRRPGRQRSAGPLSFILSWVEEQRREQGIPPQCCWQQGTAGAQDTVGL